MNRESRYLEMWQLTRRFGDDEAATPVVEGFDLTLRRGEFVSLIGHSGCGKSTVLSMVAGLTRPTLGGVVLDGRELTEPGTDRGVVFQSPSLLPWLTALENVVLAVEQAAPKLSRKQQRARAAEQLARVGLGDALDRRPGELSSGMRQRVGIARAFALDPKLLLLDEPFGMLDSITRCALQDVLIDLWRRDGKTALLVTHDVDEALFLSDRVAMMTSGPRARLGGVVEVPMPRPRDRNALADDPAFIALREKVLAFLNEQDERSVQDEPGGQGARAVQDTARAAIAQASQPAREDTSTLSQPSNRPNSTRRRDVRHETSNRNTTPAKRTTIGGTTTLLGLAVLEVLSASPAAAAEPQPQASVAAAPIPAPAPPPPPYSLPWQLRPTAAATVLRSDTSYGMFDAPDPAGGRADGTTVASTFLASYKLTPSLAPMVRLGVVRSEEPGAALGAGTAFVNPLVGALYARRLPGPLRLSGTLLFSVPVGMGGGQKRTMNETASAVFRGIAARSAMDNALFAVNYFTTLAGLDLALVSHGLTVQVEATVLQLLRVRNADIDADESRTNLTAGLHAGYFVLPMLSVGAELRYQRWLSTPAAVKMNPVARDTTTVAIGPRAHFKVSDTMWLRPGLSYSRGLDKPLTDGHYQMVQLDVPLIF